jgi:hypothetical protein
MSGGRGIRTHVGCNPEAVFKIESGTASGLRERHALSIGCRKFAANHTAPALPRPEGGLLVVENRI